MINYVLFPFDKVKKDSTIIVYGAGEIGKNFKEQIEATGFCRILYFIDKNADKIKYVDNIKCVTLNSLNDYKFDYLVIASLSYKEEIYNEILKSMAKNNDLIKEKIIPLDENYNIQINNYHCIVHNTPDWSWEKYYPEAELWSDMQFNKYIFPLLEKYNDLDIKSSTVLDFACGHGRIADKVKKLYKRVICSDISKDAINFCKERFKNDDNVNYLVNESNKIDLKDNSCNLIYSWDAMVHFSYKLLDIYTDEFYRILNKNGYAIIHHSNLVNAKDITLKSDIWHDNIGSRSNVSAEDYAYIAKKHNFKLVEQMVIDWGGIKDLDCITVLKKL